MSIELTREQLQAAAAAPLRVRDPESQTEYVLLRAEDFDRVKVLLAEQDDARMVRAMFPYLATVFGKEGWDDPAMDVYDEPGTTR